MYVDSHFCTPLQVLLLQLKKLENDGFCDEATALLHLAAMSEEIVLIAMGLSPAVQRLGLTGIFQKSRNGN
jgi:hypothetical protein